MRGVVRCEPLNAKGMDVRSDVLEWMYRYRDENHSECVNAVYMMCHASCLQNVGDLCCDKGQIRHEDIAV